MELVGVLITTGPLSHGSPFTCGGFGGPFRVWAVEICHGPLSTWKHEQRWQVPVLKQPFKFPKNDMRIGELMGGGGYLTL